VCICHREQAGEQCRDRGEQELCGLQWSDLDFEKGTVTFVRQLIETDEKGAPVFGPIKNGCRAVSRLLARRSAAFGGDPLEISQYEEQGGCGVDDGVRTRDFRSHSPALYR
jgi:integrase